MCFDTTHGLPSILCEECECFIHFECIGITANHSVVKNKNEKYVCYKCNPKYRLLLWEEVVLKKRDFSLNFSDCYPFKCKVCPKRFIKKDQAKDHNMRVHKLKCPTCKTKFDSQKHVENHENDHEKSKTKNKEKSFLIGDPVWAKWVIY